MSIALVSAAVYGVPRYLYRGWEGMCCSLGPDGLNPSSELQITWTHSPTHQTRVAQAIKKTTDLPLFQASEETSLSIAEL